MQVTLSVQKPTEGQWFEVNPKAIDQNLFQTKRKNKYQEETRQLILEAFEEIKKAPEKYGQKFKTLFPKKTWLTKTEMQLKEVASEFGGHTADWVEQALEWAQRIFNGESWDDICNTPDVTSWYRLIVWKDGICRIVGGIKDSIYDFSATTIRSSDDIFYFNNTVPLVASYK